MKEGRKEGTDRRYQEVVNIFTFLAAGETLSDHHSNLILSLTDTIYNQYHWQCNE